MHPFYISDSYTINLGSTPHPSHPGFYHEHFPGVANQTAAIPANTTALVYLRSASFEFIPFMDSIPTQGVNIDVKLGLYDITSGPASFVHILPYAPPYGTATNGMVMNSVTSLAPMVVRSERNFELTPRPAYLAQAPNNPGHIYMVGPVIHFFFGIPNVFGAYQYHMHGHLELT